MELNLKNRKRIKNGLPGFIDGIEKVAPLDIRDAKPLKIWQDNNTKPSSAAGIGPWFALGEWAGSGIGAGLNSYLSSDDIITDAGTSTGYVNGMAYLRGNDIDTQQLRRDYNKDTAMSFLTNPFKGLTMLFGHKRQMRAIRDAAREQSAINTAAMAGASTDYLQQEYAKEHSNPLSLMLYAKNGKDAVQTSHGETSGVYNSMTAENESIVSGDNTYAHQNTRPSNGDTLKSYVTDDDTVFTAQDNFNVAGYVKPAVKAIEFMNKSNIKNGGSLRDITELINRREADYLIERGKAIQRIGRELGIIGQPKIKKYNRGKENYNPKQLSNWWIDGLSALTHMGGLISDATQRIKRSNTYAENPYASNALNELASLRIDPYSINKQLMDQQRRNLYAINRAGGLSGAQKAYSNIASGLGALSTIAASNADIQKQNNAYRSAYASAALNAGLADRTARMQANQWDLDYYSKAHGAKRQEIQQDIYNALAALQQGYANSWKRHAFDRMMSRYDNSLA